MLVPFFLFFSTRHQICSQLSEKEWKKNTSKSYTFYAIRNSGKTGLNKFSRKQRNMRWPRRNHLIWHKFLFISCSSVFNQYSQWIAGKMFQSLGCYHFKPDTHTHTLCSFTYSLGRFMCVSVFVILNVCFNLRQPNFGPNRAKGRDNEGKLSWLLLPTWELSVHETVYNFHVYSFFCVLFTTTTTTTEKTECQYKIRIWSRL